MNAAINCLEKVKALAVQGKTLELAAAESTDFTWKSFLFDLKKGTLKFLANAHIDTLPTAANLKRWKKSSSDKQRHIVSTFAKWPWKPENGRGDTTIL